jgi:SAM-dependent methyltransferase
MQENAHGGAHEYRSPHLRVGEPRNLIVTRLREIIASHKASGSCTVLDVGAGHGSYTAEFLAAGASVVVCTEMSESSADRLRARFADDGRVRVVYDPEGAKAFEQSPVDVVCMISLLHHIPDYIASLRLLCDRVAPGGTLVSFQDPDYYPRRRVLARVTNRISYVMWRLTQGSLWEGAKSIRRRLTGRLDEANPRDMVEYHVVRDGVDERAVVDVLQTSFDTVELVTYWSDQGRLMQRLLGSTGLVNEFGVVARGRLAERI